MASKRLFVPLKSEVYDWYLSGCKKWELRRIGRQYTRKNVYAGRIIELRRGYNGESLFGKVGEVYEASSLEEILNDIDYKEIIPSARDEEDAKNYMAQLLGQKAGYIIFEVMLKHKK